ncbi:GDP-mannose 4,6-dehydratase [soil metagenome]
MARRVFITGITGFVGSHLAELLVARGVDVHGLAVEAPPYRTLVGLGRSVTMHRGDITDPAAMRAAVEESQPDTLVHLAGQAVPSLAARDPLAAVRINVLGTAVVVEALRGRPDARLVFASSAEVYGAPTGGVAREEAPLRPSNVYAATKVAAEALVRELGESGSTGVVIVRPVAQLGPRQHRGLAASAFARQIALAEAGRAEPVIRHGRLDPRRDLIDVRDMAEAYAAAGDLPAAGTQVFNVGSGRTVPIETVLATLMRMARVQVTGELDPDLVRPGDATATAVDAGAFRSRTGWAPKIPLERSLSDTLDHWRDEIAREALAHA